MNRKKIFPILTILPQSGFRACDRWQATVTNKESEEILCTVEEDSQYHTTKQMIRKACYSEIR